MSRKGWTIAGLGPVILALGLLAHVPTASTQQQVVKIAVAIPLTGQLARDGQGAAHAVHLAVDEWNQKGGVLGRRIEVVDADDQANPQVAVSAADKIIADPGILGVLWGITSSTCIPVSDLTERAGLVMVSPGCGNPKFTERGLKTVFRMIPRDDVQGPAGAIFAVTNLHAKKIASIDDGTAGPRGVADEMEKEAKALGATVLRYTIRSGDKDFHAVLGTIPKDSNVVYSAVWAPDAALIARQLQDVGLKVPMVGPESQMVVTDYIKASGGAAEGNYVTYYAPDIKKIASAASFVKSYQAKYGEMASYDPFFYDGANLLLTAIKNAGPGANREAVLAAVRATKDFKGVLGSTYNFDPKGDVTARVMYIYQVKGNNFEYTGQSVTVK
jgi:branched-chain amino acid transport system substrate-binding protein